MQKLLRNFLIFLAAAAVVLLIGMLLRPAALDVDVIEAVETVENVPAAEEKADNQSAEEVITESEPPADDIAVQKSQPPRQAVEPQPQTIIEKQNLK
jgi:hypothetical protein